MQPQKLAEFEKLFSDYATHEEVGSAIKDLVGAVKDVKKALEQSIKTGDSALDTKIKDCVARIKGIEKSLKSALSDNTDRTLELVRKEVEKVQKLVNDLPKTFDPTDLQNQIDVLMAYEAPKLEAVEVRDLLETLEDEERLDASAIKNLPQTVESIAGGMNKVMPLYNLLDVDIAGITAGQTIQWDGNKWVAYTPAGSGGTPVWGEDLTTQGPGTSFTLAHTPLSGTVRLFRGGAYQSVANGDYSITGDTITLTVALVADEVLVVDYSY